jgi:hypothetical protein
MARPAIGFTPRKSDINRAGRHVCFVSWLCENAKSRNGERRSYSSETALGFQLASVFNLKSELKNLILVAFRSFAFLHSQGQSRHFGRRPTTSGLPL